MLVEKSPKLTPPDHHEWVNTLLLLRVSDRYILLCKRTVSTPPSINTGHYESSERHIYMTLVFSDPISWHIPTILAPELRRPQCAVAKDHAGIQDRAETSSGMFK